MVKKQTLKGANLPGKGTRDLSLQGGAVLRKEGTLDPLQVLTLEFAVQELDKIMNYLIDTNAGVQVFLLMDGKILEAKKRRDALLSKEPKPGDNAAGDNGSK